MKMIHQQEIEKLYKKIHDLEFRLQKVEGLATLVN
jgi:hypothetical protein